MKKIIWLFFIWNSYGQTKKQGLNLWETLDGYRVGVGYNKNFELETSFLISSYPEQEQGFGGLGMRVEYFGAGLEYLLIDNKNVFGAKLSYENSLVFFSGQISTDYLFTDTSQQFRIMPKIGLTFFGRITLYYGWNIHLIKESDLQTQNQVISLQMNILK